MSEIIPYILPKDESVYELGSGAQYPFSYPDIGACFTGWSIATIYLQLNYSGLNINTIEIRTASERSGRYLAAYFNMRTVQPGVPYSPGTVVPWQDVEEPFVVSSNIYAVEKSVLDSVGFSKAELLELLAQNLKELELPSGAPAYNHKLTMTLLTRKQAVDFRWELSDNTKGSKTIAYPRS